MVEMYTNCFKDIVICYHAKDVIHTCHGFGGI